MPRGKKLTYQERFARCKSFKRAYITYDDWDNEESTWGAKLDESIFDITAREAIDHLFRFVKTPKQAFQVQSWECFSWDANPERYYYVFERVIPFFSTVEEVWEFFHRMAFGHEFEYNDIEILLLSKRLLELKGYIITPPQSKQAA